MKKMFAIMTMVALLVLAVPAISALAETDADKAPVEVTQVAPDAASEVDATAPVSEQTDGAAVNDTSVDEKEVANVADDVEEAEDVTPAIDPAQFEKSIPLFKADQKMFVRMMPAVQSDDGRWSVVMSASAIECSVKTGDVVALDTANVNLFEQMKSGEVNALNGVYDFVLMTSADDEALPYLTDARFVRVVYDNGTFQGAVMTHLTEDSIVGVSVAPDMDAEYVLIGANNIQTVLPNAKGKQVETMSVFEQNDKAENALIDRMPQILSDGDYNVIVTGFGSVDVDLVNNTVHRLYDMSEKEQVALQENKKVAVDDEFVEEAPPVIFEEDTVANNEQQSVSEVADDSVYVGDKEVVNEHIIWNAAGSETEYILADGTVLSEDAYEAGETESTDGRVVPDVAGTPSGKVIGDQVQAGETVTTADGRTIVSVPTGGEVHHDFAWLYISGGVALLAAGVFVVMRKRKAVK